MAFKGGPIYRKALYVWEKGFFFLKFNLIKLIGLGAGIGLGQWLGLGKPYQGRKLPLGRGRGGIKGISYFQLRVLRNLD